MGAVGHEEGRKKQQEGRIIKRHKRTLGNSTYVHYLDCVDSFTAVYIC